MHIYTKWTEFYLFQKSNKKFKLKKKFINWLIPYMSFLYVPALQGFPESFAPLWPHAGELAGKGWIIFSRRFIMRSCSCRHWTCRRFCWWMARRTSLHVSSMARQDLLCCCSMACMTCTFFFFRDSRLLACLLDDMGWELENQNKQNITL